MRLAPGVDREDSGSAVVAGIAMRDAHGEVDRVLVRGWLQGRALGDVGRGAVHSTHGTGRLRQGAAVSVPLRRSEP